MKLLLFVLSVAAFAADPAGKWDFVFNTPGGDRRNTITITVDKGVAKLTFPESKAPIDGAIEGDNVKFSGKLYSAEAGIEGVFKLEGKLNGDTMRGSASWEEHAMTFEARRVK
jgi:hypothetical protein